MLGRVWCVMDVCNNECVQGRPGAAGGGQRQAEGGDEGPRDQDADYVHMLVNWNPILSVWNSKYEFIRIANVGRQSLHGRLF